MRTWEMSVFGNCIRAEVQPLDNGFDVGIVGGCSTHIGAVSLAEPEGGVQTVERPGHKDRFVSEPWALRLAKAWSAPVCVRCGIHYDNADRAQIRKILETTDLLLADILGFLSK